MSAIQEDMKSIDIPSWVNPAPVNWGTTSRGKLSADQWKTICTINLPITLIRLWGREVSRKHDMLSNFIDLVTTIQLLNMCFTSEDLISHYEDCILRYLRELKSLYKHAKIKPIHHTALHIPDFMRFFGPVHSYHSQAFERYNNLLQKQNTNQKFGKSTKPNSYLIVWLTKAQVKWKQHL